VATARGGDLDGGFYVQPTVLQGNNKMRIFQEEIFGPVVSVTTFKTDEAPAMPCSEGERIAAGSAAHNRIPQPSTLGR
jgi:acyl-CoA reductase-like NAD-dependent aldehyde dehydrogenase